MVCFVWQSCKMMQSVSRLFYYCVTVCFQPGSAMFCGRQSFHLFFGSLFSVAFFVSTCIKILWSSSVWPVRPTPKSYRHSLHQEDPDLLDTIPSPGHKIQGVQNTKFQNCTASINRTHIGYTNSLPLALNGMSGKTCLSKHSGHLGSSDLTETKKIIVLICLDSWETKVEAVPMPNWGTGQLREFEAELIPRRRAAACSVVPVSGPSSAALQNRRCLWVFLDSPKFHEIPWNPSRHSEEFDEMIFKSDLQDAPPESNLIFNWGHGNAPRNGIFNRMGARAGRLLLMRRLQDKVHAFRSQRITMNHCKCVQRCKRSHSSLFS